MQISRNIVNELKSNNYVLVRILAIICVQKPPHHFLQTLRHYACFKIVFRDSQLYPKQLSFILSAIADRNGYSSLLISEV